MKPCRVCGNPFEPKPHQIKRGDYACKDCDRRIDRKDYSKNKTAYRTAQSRHQLANPQAGRARNMVQDAIKNGTLKREPCFMCGAPAQAHHSAYDLPLHVTWLCKEHHEQAHHG